MSWFTDDDLLTLEDREELDDVTKLARELRGLRQFIARIHELHRNGFLPVYIAAAAWRDVHGVVHSLPPPARHGDVAQVVAKSTPERILYSPGDGFITNQGDFVTREEAYEIASAANQIVRRCGGDEGRLFTENLF